MESRFDKLEAVLNKIVDYLEKGKNPVISSLVMPIPKQVEILSNEETSFQNSPNWNNPNGNPISTSTPANIRKNSTYQQPTMEIPTQSTCKSDPTIRLRTRFDKLESLIANLISKINNNFPDKEQITIDFNLL